MIAPTITLVVPDGTGLQAVDSAQMRWQFGVDFTQPVRVVHQDGSSYDLGGAVAAILAFYENDDDDAPTLQLEWTITGANTAEFRFPRAMASLLPITDRGYAVGVRFRDDDTGYEDAVLLPGRAVVDRRVGDFALPVATPSSGSPLARAPNFIPTATQTDDYAAAVDELVVCDCSGGDMTVTLPLTTGIVGRRVGVVLLAAGVNSVSIVGSGGEEIRGSASPLVMTSTFEVLELVALSGEWT